MIEYQLGSTEISETASGRFFCGSAELSTTFYQTFMFYLEKARSLEIVQRESIAARDRLQEPQVDLRAYDKALVLFGWEGKTGSSDKAMVLAINNELAISHAMQDIQSTVRSSGVTIIEELQRLSLDSFVAHNQPYWLSVPSEHNLRWLCTTKDQGQNIIFFNRNIALSPGEQNAQIPDYVELLNGFYDLII